MKAGVGNRAVISLELMFESWEESKSLGERLGRAGPSPWVEGSLTKQPKNWEKTRVVLTAYIKKEKGVCKQSAQSAVLEAAEQTE